ncbi:MAG: sulfite exporter TauE/SafE family protein [Patescibacteria group bacterium]
MSNTPGNDLNATVRINGMHCASCEILLERKLRALKGMKHISVNHRTGIAKLTADGSSPPSFEEIEAIVKSAGYSLSEASETESGAVTPPSASRRGVLLLTIGGMPPREENILRHKLKSIPGVHKTSVDAAGENKLKLYYQEFPDPDAIKQAVAHEGYRFISLEEVQEHARDEQAREEEQPHKRWLEIGGALLIIFAIFKLLSAFDLVSLAPSTTGALSWGGIFLIGIVAGTSSCLAVTGGLLLAAAAKYNEVNQSQTTWQKFRPLLQFNIGRILSYFVLGGAVGLIGQSITLTPKMTGLLNIFIAFVMLSIALSILKILPKNALGIKPPKALSHWIHDLAENKHPLAPFALGAMTFFLPCGFTQSLQLVALASGNFWTGAMTMFIFALGTAPALLGISALSSTASGTSSRLFLRFAGTLVLVLSVFNLNSALALTGFDVGGFAASLVPAPAAGDGGGNPSPGGTAPAIVNGVQEVAMSVTGYGYDPAFITIKAGVPVRFVIDGTEAGGCTRGFVIPSLNISKVLQSGENVIEFTAPSTPGRVAFSCSMGMVRGAFNVI